MKALITIILTILMLACNSKKDNIVPATITNNCIIDTVYIGKYVVYTDNTGLSNNYPVGNPDYIGDTLKIVWNGYFENESITFGTTGLDYYCNAHSELEDSSSCHSSHHLKLCDDTNRYKRRLTKVFGSDDLIYSFYLESDLITYKSISLRKIQ